MHKYVVTENITRASKIYRVAAVQKALVKVAAIGLKEEITVAIHQDASRAQLIIDVQKAQICCINIIFNRPLYTS